MKKFEYGISKWIAFQDKNTCRRVLKIKKEDLAKHSNPDFKINIIKDSNFTFQYILDIFNRIKKSSEEGKRLVLILPQPNPQYSKVAKLINKFRINCKNLWTFNMDEWADDDGNTAPETWQYSFMSAMNSNFYYQIDKDLRPPRKQVLGPNNKNCNDYGKMIEDLGGADVCYGGIGWSGHLAFIEPGSKEFEGSFEEWKKMGTRIVTISPFTLAQSSLDPDFGMSGNWSAIPPKAITIGPAEIFSAKLRSSWNCFTIAGTDVSWQRFIIRLAAHAPVNQFIPASILQITRSDLFISDTIAKEIVTSTEFNWYG